MCLCIMRHVSNVIHQKNHSSLCFKTAPKTLTLIVGYDNSSNGGIGLKAETMSDKDKTYDCCDKTNDDD